MRLTPYFNPVHSDRVTGNVQLWHDVPSAHLYHSRHVIIWLPPGYDDDDSRRYPVLYAQDGQNLFNPDTAFAGTAWDLEKITTHLIDTGQIEPCIIVGIYNTPDRLYEYNPLRQQGQQYGRFLVEELMPAIDHSFRTVGGRRNALIGSSMGGLISTAFLWWHSDHFFGAAAMSPSYWVLWQAGGPANWLHYQRIRPQHPSLLYIDRGTDRSESRIDGHAQEVLQVCRDSGFLSEQLMYHVAQGGQHNEASWRARSHLPLDFLFGRSPWARG
ncbi:MAG: alpha/beta hydrolase [Anaerolineales bacterium]|nr:alpha/beta hydrolase [Anaerolineales bacterium]MCB9127462.1 alpha/beta hydrolase [Ardenticatenales bacterium]MCB9172205.1 alpha/beta hydrolase [Ardenticatenales bacterium]